MATATATDTGLPAVTSLSTMATSEVARRRAVLLLATCSVGLIPWTIGLAVTLPRDYMVGNWALAWTGFDVVLIGCFAVTGWALWKQRQVALPAAITTSVLLLCDAWFDLLTAHGGNDRLVSSLTALFGEIPIAILLAAIAARLLRAGVGAGRDVPQLHRAVPPGAEQSGLRFMTSRFIPGSGCCGLPIPSREARTSVVCRLPCAAARR